MCSQGKEGEAVVAWPLLCLIFHKPLLEQLHLVCSGCASTVGQGSIKLLFPIFKKYTAAIETERATSWQRMDLVLHHFSAVTTLKPHPAHTEVGGKAPIAFSGCGIRPLCVNMVGTDPLRPCSWFRDLCSAFTEAMLVKWWHGSGRELHLICALWLSVHLSSGISG